MPAIALRIWVSALLIGFSTFAPADDLILRFTDKDNAVAIEGHWQFLDDPDAALDIAAAREALQRGQFEALEQSLNRGYTTAASWLYVRIARDEGAPANLYLLLEPVYLDEVDVFVLKRGAEGTGEITQHRFGDHRPITERALPQTRAVLPLALRADEPVDVFVRIRSLSTHLFEAKLLDEASMERAVQWRLLAHGGYVAVAFALALVHFLLAYRLRDRVLLIYAAYVMGLGIGYAAIEGISALVFTQSIHLFNDWLVSIGTGLSFVLIAWLVMVIFKTGEQHRWTHYFLWAVVVLGAAAFLSTGTALYPQISQWLFLSGLAFVFIALYLAWVHYRAGDPAGRLFLIAFTVSGIGAIISFLRILGLLPVNPLTQHAIQLTSFAHMMLMSLALSERVLAAEDAAKTALRNAESRAVTLANEMTEKLAESKRELERTLMRERDLRGEQAAFIDTISHEYRTPLSVLQTNVDILHSRGELSESRFAAMGSALKRLGGIFDDALQTHRLGRPPEIALQPLNLVAVLKETVADWQSAHPDCPVYFDLPAVSIPAEADRRMIQLILFNLLDNAFKYRYTQTSDAGIRIHLSALDGWVRLAISNAIDPSIGIDRSNLLERFVRDAGAAEQPGHGLGLYLVRRGVEEMGGRVTIDQEDEGRFCVVVELPQAPEGNDEH